MAAHVVGWIAGICLALFFGVGAWTVMPVMWNFVNAPSDAERSDFAARRARIPFRAWFGLGLTGAAALLVYAGLR
jgi:hypothetical protein